MHNNKFDVLKRMFEIIKNIEKTSSKTVLELLPIANASTYYRSDVQQVIPGLESRYLLMLHNGDSLLGKYYVLSIRNEIYINGKLSVDKSRSFYISIPRFLLACIEILQQPEEVDMGELSKQIMAILSTTQTVNNRNISYSSALSVNIRHSLSDFKALKESMKVMVMQEQNLCFAINDEEKFSKNVFSILTYIEKLNP